MDYDTLTLEISRRVIGQSGNLPSLAGIVNDCIRLDEYIAERLTDGLDVYTIFLVSTHTFQVRVRYTTPTNKCQVYESAPREMKDDGNFLKYACMRIARKMGECFFLIEGVE